MSAVTQNYVEDLEAKLAKAKQDRDAYQRIAQGLSEEIEAAGVSPADLRHSRDQWKEQARQSGEDAHALLSLLCEIRTAAGDPEGKLMQPELVRHIRHMKEDVDLLRRSYHNACEELSDLKAALVEEGEAPPIGPSISLVEGLKARQVAPEGMALVPRSITADTGHKAGMMGDFEERIERECNWCDGTGVDVGTCENCEGSGEMTIAVPVSWTTLKAIHRRIVEIAEGGE